MKRPWIITSILLGLLLLFGGVMMANPFQDRQAALHRFEKVFHEILNRYVTEVDAGKLIDAGIEGMLDELDPYTQYIIESNSHRIDALTNGAYGGIGIRLGKMGDSLVVVSPMDGTPAERFGILAGDIIVRIDSLSTRKTSLAKASQMLRGKAGTLVTLGIRRNGGKEIIYFDLVRELIKVPDISYSGLIEPGVGYIKLANFSKFSSENLERAVRKLDRTGIEALVLDLRGNPGGLLSAALLSADLFIKEGETLLETRGRIARANREFHSRRKPILSDDVDMLVLVDRGSASASEILAGILQDYDRAVIIGRDTFGKGLVQTVFTIDDETRLKVTTAKYYLPSGRLIQKHDFGEDVRLDDLLEPDSISFYTANRRPFSGGGGILPDISVESFKRSSFEKDLWRMGFFFHYALDYTEEQPNLGLPFVADSMVLEDFRTWLLRRSDLPPSDLEKYIAGLEERIDTRSSYIDSLKKYQSALQGLSSLMWLDQFDQDSERITRGIEMEISNIIGGRGARQAASLNTDPDIRVCLESLGKEGYLDSLLMSPTYSRAY